MSHGVLTCLNFQNLASRRKLKDIKKKKNTKSPSSSQPLTAWKELQQRIRSKVKTPRASARPCKSLIGNLHRGFVSIQVLYTLIFWATWKYRHWYFIFHQNWDTIRSIFTSLNVIYVNLKHTCYVIFINLRECGCYLL